MSGEVLKTKGGFEKRKGFELDQKRGGVWASSGGESTRRVETGQGPTCVNGGPVRCT